MKIFVNAIFMFMIFLKHSFKLRTHNKSKRNHCNRFMVVIGEILVVVGLTIGGKLCYLI